MTVLTPLPPAPSTSDPTNFAAEADAMIAALVTMVTEINAAGGVNVGNATTLLGATWSAPGTIGDGTPAAGHFTTLSASGITTLNARAVMTKSVDDATSAFAITNSAATATNQYGYSVVLAGDPNDATRFFFSGVGTSTDRFVARTNGGLANFSTNNANLSDMGVKSVHEVFTDVELDALEESFVGVNWGKNKYKDQTHDDWNFGYTAQGVKAAFANTVPSMVDDWQTERRFVDEDGMERVVEIPKDERLLCVYDNDLTHISHALLARLIKRVKALESA